MVHVSYLSVDRSFGYDPKKIFSPPLLQGLSGCPCNQKELGKGGGKRKHKSVHRLSDEQDHLS